MKTLRGRHPNILKNEASTPINVSSGGFKRELRALPTMISRYKNISRSTKTPENAGAATKGQKSPLFRLASYPLIEIKKIEIKKY